MYLVDAKRFLQEYKNHIDLLENKFVNWTKDISTGYIRLYIQATSSSEVYCHIHEDKDFNTLPAGIRDLIKAEGMVLGTIDLSNVNTEANESMREIAQSIKFNMVGDKP